MLGDQKVDLDGEFQLLIERDVESFPFTIGYLPPKHGPYNIPEGLAFVRVQSHDGA